MTDIPDLEVLEVKAMIVTEDPADGVIFSVEIAGGQIINLILPQAVAGKIEGCLTRMSVEVAKEHRLQ